MEKEYEKENIIEYIKESLKNNKEINIENMNIEIKYNEEKSINECILNILKKKIK